MSPLALLLVCAGATLAVEVGTRVHARLARRRLATLAGKHGFSPSDRGPTATELMPHLGEAGIVGIASPRLRGALEREGRVVVRLDYIVGATGSRRNRSRVLAVERLATGGWSPPEVGPFELSLPEQYARLMARHDRAAAAS